MKIGGKGLSLIGGMAVAGFFLQISVFLSCVAAAEIAKATAIVNKNTGNSVGGDMDEGALQLLLLSDDNINSDSVVVAAINPSRTSCASPCTVVFSADGTTAEGVDSHGVWSQLSYYWDFDTDETDTYGSLYNQTYTYVAGDTAREIGHVPMVTKTFLCKTGICVYNVGMRAQNATGDYDDEFVAITVESESTHWSAANTVCISNTLNTGDDWTVYDKPCPAGATKQSVTLDYDQYNGKLVLFKKGDVFTQNIAMLPSESNFKIGVFGDAVESRPEIDGDIDIGVTNFSGPANAPTAANNLGIDNADYANYGWPSNIYIEGLKLTNVNFPMSYQHIGIHDIDMDATGKTSGGRIGVSEDSVTCVNAALDCANVPFPKGGYISSVDIVGFTVDGTPGVTSDDGGPGVNIVDTQCSMVNFLGIVDTRVRNAREHNLRVAGWYRFNIMHSFFRGEHYLPSKSKITPRRCLSPNVIYGGGAVPAGENDTTNDWANSPYLPAYYLTDIEGRTRADMIFQSGGIYDGYHVKGSRYFVASGNTLGEVGLFDYPNNGGSFGIDTSTSYPQGTIIAQDFLISKTIVNSENYPAETAGGLDIGGHWGTCVDNTYNQDTSCASFSGNNAIWNPRIDPTPITPPFAPGSW